jgi:hypothetical protein
LLTNFQCTKHNKPNDVFLVEEIDIAIRFAKREFQFLSSGSNEYQFEHQYEINRIDKLQIGGDVAHVKEVALSYKNQ